MKSTNYSIESILSKINRNTRINQPVKIENNTYAELYQGEIYIRLHGNIISQVKENYITLYTQGWHTPTTKDRINKILRDNETNFILYQENSVWFLSKIPNWSEKYKFSEGVKLINLLNNKGWQCIDYSEFNNKEIDTKKRQIRVYVKNYIDQLNQGKITIDENRNCPACTVSTYQDIKHLNQHIENKQYPFNLLVQAIEKYGVSILAKTELIGIFFNEPEKLINCKSLNQITINQLTASLSRYLIDRLITNL